MGFESCGDKSLERFKLGLGLICTGAYIVWCHTVKWLRCSLPPVYGTISIYPMSATAAWFVVTPSSLEGRQNASVSLNNSNNCNQRCRLPESHGDCNSTGTTISTTTSKTHHSQIPNAPNHRAPPPILQDLRNWILCALAWTGRPDDHFSAPRKCTERCLMKVMTARVERWTFTGHRVIPVFEGIEALTSSVSPTKPSLIPQNRNWSRILPRHLLSDLQAKYT